MRTHSACISCLLKQAPRTAELLTDDPLEIENFTVHIKNKLKTINMALPPPVHGGMIHREAETWFGVPDPYKKLKEDHIRQAASMSHELKEMISASDDPLLAAVKLAIGGNAIDFGVSRPFHLISELKGAVHRRLAIDHYRLFREKLKEAESILYLGDNAGESVLDRLLIETIGKPVVFVARHRPAINDITVEDAKKSGLSEVATVISSGSSLPGTIPQLCHRSFREQLNKSDLIISKGQGNYETLSDENRPLFFLLMIKCPVVASDLNVPEGSFILKSAIQQGIPI